jgi:transposase InsO family protein
MGISHMQEVPMKKDAEQKQRILAAERFNNGEKPESICVSLGRSRAWLYKWVKRRTESNNNEFWSENQSRRPQNISQTPKEIEEVVKFVRLKLYNRDLFCGAQAILWELEDLDVTPLPSLRTINRILSRNELTYRRTGKYEPKGTEYPTLDSTLPNSTHQADLVGPCYLKGPIRFYSLNIVDISTARCGIQPSISKGSKSITDCMLEIWRRLGIPDKIQIDNALTFRGSNRHPKGMGSLIRMCLHNNVEPWFIPMAEPWRNGTVEHFNNFYRQKFLKKVFISSEKELVSESIAFEQRHNSSYRYSRIGGKTPLKVLGERNSALRFPDVEKIPGSWREKPETGRYHLVRLIRSDLRINVFNELFPVPPELEYEYVVATIDVKEQKLKLFSNKKQVEQFDYRVR